MATHFSTLAWKIPWTEELGRLQSMRSLRVGHDWATSLSLFTFLHWRRKWQPTPVFLPGESQGRGSLVGCRLWGRTVGHDWSNLADLAVLRTRHCFKYLTIIIFLKNIDLFLQALVEACRTFRCGMWDPVPQPGPPVLRAQSLSCWTTREAPSC